jgi:hypothetical protein
METPVAAAHGPREVPHVTDIPVNSFDGGALQAALIGAGAEEGLHGMAAGGQFVDEVGPDKAGGASHKAIHGR